MEDNKEKRSLDFEVNTAGDLNKMLTGLLMDVRRGSVPPEQAKVITLVADKINKNNVNILEYKKMTKHKNDLDFFDQPTVKKSKKDK
jgi:hypothetical protein